MLIYRKNTFFFLHFCGKKIDLKNGDVEVMPLGQNNINFYHFNFSQSIISSYVSDIKLHL